MSYAKAMKHSIRASRKQANGLVFCTVAKNERRLFPWLGSYWYEDGRIEERNTFIEEWHKETKRLLEQNSVVLVDTGDRTIEQINEILGV